MTPNEKAMITFEEAGEYLDTLIEKLPEGILRELNGGINLLPEEKPSSVRGLSVLGMYYSGGQMGRYIELYYGSLVRLFGGNPPSVLKNELKKTLYHELTHHLESLAGERSLEREDERFLEDMRQSRS